MTQTNSQPIINPPTNQSYRELTTFNHIVIMRGPFRDGISKAPIFILIMFLLATCCIVASKDLHWSLHTGRDIKEINLSSLRMLLLADRANPCKFCNFVIIALDMYK